jgi:endonuclease/exonuclease/phosphatase family metal-dependent hydrolase
MMLRCLAALAALALSLGAVQTPALPAPIGVMSFNIRYGTANDGDNRWPNRRALLFDVVRGADADLVGLQEALDAQIREIVAAVPGYAVVGVGRDDGRTRGEYAAILVRTARFHVAESGTFWFSDTPSVIASRSWGNTVTRICTWARLVDGDGRALWIYNVHLDHESQPSRERSARLLADRIAARPGAGEPVVVTGDFNAGEDNPALAVLTSPGVGAGLRLVDTFRVRQPDAVDVGTFTGFAFGRTAGPKIDYILVEPATEVLDAAIVRTSRDGRYPSDHFPVTARIRFSGARLGGRAAVH